MSHETITRSKQEIAGVLDKLPEIFKNIGIDCNIAVDVNDGCLSVTMGVKSESMKDWITIVRDFANRMTVVEFWRHMTMELACAFLGISKTLMSAEVRPLATGDCFVFRVYYCDDKKAFSWRVYPKPDCIEVKEGEAEKEVLSWEEYLKKTVYTTRLVMEVGNDD
jgi:hypothetical protein